MATNNSVNTYIVPTTANEVTMPSQPAFLAYNGIQRNNVTGNGTVYTVIFNTSQFDQNSDFNTTTGVFTAPVSGRYTLSTSVNLQGITNATSFNIVIVTSNRSYTSFTGRAPETRNFAFQQTCIADMDATDTAYVTIASTGEGADDNDVFGGISTFFCGMLLV